MKHKSIPLLLVLVLLSTHAPLALAQQSASTTQPEASTNSWAAVQQLKTNERLVVKQKNGKELKGLMIEATDTTLTIDRDGKPVAIARDDVRRVSVIERKAEKGKYALIGAGIGAGTGTAIGYAAYDPHGDNEVYIFMGSLIGVGTGALGGFLFGQGKRKRTMIYSVN